MSDNPTVLSDQMGNLPRRALELNLTNKYYESENIDQVSDKKQAFEPAEHTGSYIWNVIVYSDTFLHKIRKKLR